MSRKISLDQIGYTPDIVNLSEPGENSDNNLQLEHLKKALEKAIGESYDIIDETGKPMEWLLRNYIDKGMPVVFWACIDMREPVTGPEWKLLDGGGVFTWISNEHCMLLVGYDADGYYFNDPYEGHGVIHYPKALVENRHRAQYEMAVGVIKKN